MIATTELIHVELLDNGISTTDEAQEIASNLHTELASVTVVNSPSTQAIATAKAVEAQRFLKQLEIKPSAVNATCNAATVIPGMKFWEELTTSFRR